jgi:hypothetical protein
MDAPVFRNTRIQELLISGFFILAGAALLVAKGAPALPIGLGAIGFGLIAVLMFELYLRKLRSVAAQTRTQLAAVAQQALDAPVAVNAQPNPHFAELAFSSRLGRRLMMPTSVPLWIDGSAQGQRLGIGIAVSLGKNTFTKFTHSYMVADAKGTSTLFRVLTNNRLGKMVRHGATQHPAATNDPAFDQLWIVDADESLAHAVLDGGARQALVQLASSFSQSELASVELLPQGLVLRWPRPVTPATAQSMRDLVGGMRDRLVAHAARTRTAV